MLIVKILWSKNKGRKDIGKEAERRKEEKKKEGRQNTKCKERDDQVRNIMRKK